MELSEITTGLVRWSMNLSQIQAQIASRNIANANITGYQPQRIDFTEQLALLRANSGDAESIAAALRTVSAEGFRLIEETAPTLLGEGVQLDHEIAQLTMANTRYTTLVDALNRHLGLMRLAVTGRG